MPLVDMFALTCINMYVRMLWYGIDILMCISVYVSGLAYSIRG